MDGDKLVGIVTTFDVLKYEFKKEYDNIILYKDVFEPNLRTV
jgi:CBS domain-containing protein